MGPGLAGAAALVISFALLDRRVAVLPGLCAAQATAVAAAAAWQGWLQGGAGLWMAALLVLAVNGIAIPLALHRLATGLPNAPRARFPWLVLGAGLALLAALAVLPGVTHGVDRQELGAALATVLLGALMTLVGRGVPAQLLGLLSAANGLVLAGTGMPGLPLLPALALAAMALPAAALAGVRFLGLGETR